MDISFNRRFFNIDDDWMLGVRFISIDSTIEKRRLEQVLILMLMLHTFAKNRVFLAKRTLIYFKNHPKQRGLAISRFDLKKAFEHYWGGRAQTLMTPSTVIKYQYPFQ